MLQINSGATLQLDGADSLEVVFTNSTGTLILKDPASFTGTISGLSGNDQIDLANIDWATAQVSSVTYSPSTNLTTLVITDGTHTDTIQLAGDYTASSWTFANDGSGGTILVDPIKSVLALDAIEAPVAEETIVALLDATDPSSLIARNDKVTTASGAETSSTASSNATSTASEFANDVVQSGYADTGHFGRTTTGLLGGKYANEVSALAASQELDPPSTDANDHAANPLLPAWLVKLLSSNTPLSAADFETPHIHLGAANTGNYALDPQFSEMPI